MTTERFETYEIYPKGHAMRFDSLKKGLEASGYTGVKLVGARECRVDVTVAEKINRLSLMAALQRIARGTIDD